MDNIDRLIQAIDVAEQSAYGSESDSELQQDRAIAIDMYHGRNIEPAPDGRSQIVDRTAFETVQWILPSLCRIFANGDSIVEFQPFGPEDEEPAKQESDYLNYLVTQKNPWFNIFHDWAHDALVTKNGYCLVYVEEKLQTELETYERQAEESLALLLDEEGVEVVQHEAVPDEKNPVPVVDPATGQPAIDPMTGQPMMQPRMLHTVTIRKTKPAKKLCFRVLPPERTKVDINTDSFSLEHCKYFEYWDTLTISDLRALGFEVPDDIGSGDDELDDTEERRARDLYDEETIENDNQVDPSLRRVRARMIWISHDTDEDGIAELQYCVRVGSQILNKDGKPAIYPVTRIPVACVTPNINPHRHIGTSEIDITGDIQRIKTAMLRGGLDGMNLALNPRHIVSNEVNIDDLLVSRPGGIVRMSDQSAAIPGEGHIIPITTQNTLPDAIAGLEYMGVVHEGRTGVSRAFAGVDPGTLNKGNSSGVAINQLSTMASQRVEQIARIFASGVKYLFSVAHELLIKSGHQSDVVKLRGKWTTIDPTAWKTGRDMQIVVGYGAGNKDALVSRLSLIANVQKEMLMGGLPTVTPQNIYETAIEITKASDFSAPQRFFTDPSTVPPPPPPQPSPDVVAAGQIELEKSKSAERIKLAELQSQERIKGAELVQEEELAKFEAEVKIAIEQMSQGGSMDLEKVRAHLKSEPVRVETKKIEENSKVLEMLAQLQANQAKALEGMSQRLEQAVKSLSAPRRIVRGKDGRVEGAVVG